MDQSPRLVHQLSPSEEKIALFRSLFRGREDVYPPHQKKVHGFNVSAAHVWAEQEHQLEKAGRPMPVEDSYIAATARRYGLTMATGNEQDFRRPGLNVFNPTHDGHTFTDASKDHYPKGPEPSLGRQLGGESSE